MSLQTRLVDPTAHILHLVHCNQIKGMIRDETEVACMVFLSLAYSTVSIVRPRNKALSHTQKVKGSFSHTERGTKPRDKAS